MVHSSLRAAAALGHGSATATPKEPGAPSASVVLIFLRNDAQTPQLQLQTGPHQEQSVHQRSTLILFMAREEQKELISFNTFYEFHENVFNFASDDLPWRRTSRSRAARLARKISTWLHRQNKTRGCKTNSHLFHIPE